MSVHQFLTAWLESLSSVYPSLLTLPIYWLVRHQPFFETIFSTPKPVRKRYISLPHNQPSNFVGHEIPHPLPYPYACTFGNWAAAQLKFPYRVKYFWIITFLTIRRHFSSAILQSLKSYSVTETTPAPANSGGSNPDANKLQILLSPTLLVLSRILAGNQLEIGMGRKE